MKREEKKGLPFFGIPKLAPYLKPYRMLFFWMVTMGGIGSAMDAVIPLFQQHAIDHFIAEKTMDGIGGFLALYILVMLVQTATNYISAYGACKVELYIGRDLKREAFNHLQTLSFSYFNQNSVGYIHARVMSDTDRIASTLAWGLMEGVWYIAYLLFAVVMMFVLNWHLALCVMVIVPVLVVSGAYFQKKLVFFHRRVREQNSRITGAFNEGITGAKTTKTLVIEDKVEREFDGLTGEMKRMSVRAMHFRSVFMSTTAFAASVALAIVLVADTGDVVLLYGVGGANVVGRAGEIVCDAGTHDDGSLRFTGARDAVRGAERDAENASDRSDDGNGGRRDGRPVDKVCKAVAPAAMPAGTSDPDRQQPTRAASFSVVNGTGGGEANGIAGTSNGFDGLSYTCHLVAERHGLTRREEEILQLLVRGRSTARIAETLCITPATTRTHLRNIYAKLDVHSQQEVLDLYERERGSLRG